MIAIPIDIAEKNIRIRQRSPSGYVRFRIMTLSASKGIRAIIGFLPGGGSEVQSYLFLKTQWTLDRAKAWVRAHKGKPSGV